MVFVKSKCSYIICANIQRGSSHIRNEPEFSLIIFRRGAVRYKLEGRGFDSPMLLLGLSIDVILPATP